MTCAQRMCQAEGCTNPLPADATHRRTFCSSRCRARVGARLKAREKGLQEKAKPAFIRELRAQVPAGLCVYCRGPLAQIQRFICSSPKCKAAYSVDHRRAKRNGDHRVDAAEVEALAAECAEELRASTLRLSLQLDAFRAGVRELCQQLSCEVSP